MTNSLEARLSMIRAGVSAKRQRLGSESPGMFAGVYLRHHMCLPASRMHMELFEMLADATKRRGQRIAVAAPRGHAKSTVASLAYILWSLLFNREPHVLLISATREQAEQHLQNIKHEIQNNEMLLVDFPRLCQPSNAKGKPKPWRQNVMSLSNGTLVRALGAGQAVRGVKHRQDRPTLILVDDLENQEQCESADQRRKTRDWFHKTLLKAGSDRTNIVVVGTIVHYDSLLANLTYPKLARGKGVGWSHRVYKAVESPADRSDLWDKWEAVRFGEAEHDGESGLNASMAFFEANRDEMLKASRVLWPEREDYLQLMEIRADEGRLSFQSEKQNDPLDPEECIFSESSLKYWDDEYADIPELLRAIGSNARIYGACDPSLGQRASRGDYTAIITLVQDRKKKTMYVIDADIARRKPAETIERIVALAKTYTYRHFAFETNQFQELMADQLRVRARAAGVSLYPKSVTHSTHKQTRIECLEPLITSGQLRFSRRHSLLLDQLRQFPLGAHDDGPDALEMAVDQAMKHRVVGYTVSIM